MRKRVIHEGHLLLVLITSLFLLRSGGSTLPLNTTRASSTIGRGECEVDVFLGVQTDNEGRDVDNLLADTGVEGGGASVTTYT